MQYIPIETAADAMGVSVSSVRGWIRKAELQAEQTITGIWWVSSASCRALIRSRAGLNSITERRFDAIVGSAEIAPSPFEDYAGVTA